MIEKVIRGYLDKKVIDVARRNIIVRHMPMNYESLWETCI